MKNLLKKLHIKHSQSEVLEGSTSSKSNKLSDVSTPERFSHSEHKSVSAISGWLNSVTNRRSPSPPLSSNVNRGERIEQSDSASSSALEADLDAVLHDSDTSNLRDPDTDEDYQMQLALELSAREDPEAVQIEAVKQISLGPSHLENTAAEVVAYRYWNYNALSYDDAVTDGFYDLYGISMESTSSEMPSLINLRSKSTTDNITWEAILVNTVTDSDLKHLRQKASEIAARSEFPNLAGSGLVKELAALVSDYMGGPVGDPDNMFMAWKSLSFNLRESLGSLVLPLGSVTVGLPRHRALLFKFLADSVGIPCRLAKGQQYTGSDDVAMNFVRVDDDREYIVDLMADPGTLIPSDIAGSHIEYEKSFVPANLLAVNPTLIDSSSSEVNILHKEVSEQRTRKDGPSSSNISAAGRKSREGNELVSFGDMFQCDKAEEEDKSSAASPVEVKKDTAEFPNNPNKVHILVRSPSWTEGVSSPAAHKMKVKDVSQYMIDAAKENPQLAQKLHAVLLESGVVAPPNLFTEIHQEETNIATVEHMFPFEYSDSSREGEDSQKTKGQGPQEDQPNAREVLGQLVSSQSDVAPSNFERNIPVASAAAAAAVVASSIVVAASRKCSDSNLELSVAAAATAKAAVLVATTAALSKQYENWDSHSPGVLASSFDPLGHERRVGDPEVHVDATVYEPQGRGHQVVDAVQGNPDAEKTSEIFARQESITAASLDEVSDCEIPWEDITLGERIGLGSYGEVYRGDWHGTEVAVKKFLDQIITSESLKEFKSEVLIMKRARHPNVVLFMGAVTRAPNLSIVTEFLPRGSLYRLIHKPNNQLDVRRRMRMALDAARGMNYLHNCTPVIVHRDLKSPNLLVDKNWVVKVCDFGLSRMKYNTFLSSRSTAGTPFL